MEAATESPSNLQAPAGPESTDPSASQQPSPSQPPVTPEKPRRGLVEKGSFNHTIVAVGRRGSGKSEYGVGRCLAFAKQPCYIVAHDPGWKIPDQLHDGRKTFARRCSTAAEARQLFAKDPRGIFSISSPSCDEVMALANEIAEQSLEANGGERGHPCVLYIDEVVSAEICDPHYIDPKFKQFLMESRHRNVGVIVGTQSARILHNLLFTQATHVELFRITDEKDHKRLIECGLDKETVARTRQLPPFKHITAVL